MSYQARRQVRADDAGDGWSERLLDDLHGSGWVITIISTARIDAGAAGPDLAVDGTFAIATGEPDGSITTTRYGVKRGGGSLSSEQAHSA